MATLYTTALSANGRKPLLLDHRLGLGLDVETVNVYLGEGRSPEYLSLNPWGKIPTLVDGDLVLWESNAILVYLSERYGSSAMWSTEPQQRAEIARWLFWESSSWQPALIPVLTEPVSRLLVAPEAEEGSSPIEEGEGRANWDDPGLLPLLEHLDSHLDSRTYLAGSEPTLADLSVAAMTMYLGPVGFPWQRFPAFARWCRAIASSTEWRTTAIGPWQ